jgi:membrane protein DedA with SNARE-associated domain
MSALSTPGSSHVRPWDVRWLAWGLAGCLLPIIILTPNRAVLALFFGTFVSEDLTCVTAGVLAQLGLVNLLEALIGCGLGIFISDLGLWLAGYALSLGLVRWNFIRDTQKTSRWQRYQEWLRARGIVAIFLTRFIPGSRLPIYLAAGVMRIPLQTMALGTGLGTLIWTPMIVGSIALLPMRFFSLDLVSFWPWLLGSACLALIAPRLATLSTLQGRAAWSAALSRLWRWEFWPAWLFYLSLVPYWLYLAARYRSFTVWTAANPGIPHGGVVGESKHEILLQLPQHWIVPSVLIPAANFEQRLRHLLMLMQDRSWIFPIILKPDVGERGKGVAIIHDVSEATNYLHRHAEATIAQVYHPGPYEVGIFYYRYPGETQGHIFSITEKTFPVVIGDGRSTLSELIWKHSRYRMQAHGFLSSLSKPTDYIPAHGEAFPLSKIGNHCRGTLFRDGERWRTSELEAQIDNIARQFPGFFIGRFDIRFRDMDEFKQGTQFSIVELNGVTSESTNLYDPENSLWKAYSILFKQWRLLFSIGSACQDRGAESISSWQLLKLVIKSPSL